MKAYWGVNVQLHAFFNLGTRWRWVVSFTPRLLYPQRKSPLYPLDRRLGGPQNRYGRGGEEKNSQPLPGLEPPIIQPVIQHYATELPRFLMWQITTLKMEAARPPKPWYATTSLHGVTIQKTVKWSNLIYLIANCYYFSRECVLLTVTSILISQVKSFNEWYALTEENQEPVSVGRKKESLPNLCSH
jgi:hypothetical protein